MDVQQVSRWVSDARFARFLTVAADDHEAAVKLYMWNAELSAACFETMHHFEVLVRNTVDQRLGPRQPNQPLSSTWLHDRNVLTDRGLEQVDEAVNRLRDAGQPFTRDRVVAALNFGFWRGLFGPPYEELWRRKLSGGFHGAGTRRKLHDPLEHLRVFRNRLAHHDSLLTVDVRRRFIEMIQIATWADPAAGRWLRDSSRVVDLLKARP